MNIKNILIRCVIHFVKIFRKNALIGPPLLPNRILVVSTTGLGDTLWATPALRALREKFPKAYIAVLTSPIGREVLLEHPLIDEIFLLKNSKLISFFSLYFKMRKKSFQAALIFHISQRPVLPFCFMLGIKQILGTQGINKDLDFILTGMTSRKPVHEIERRLEIVALLGAEARNPQLELPISSADRQAARAFLSKHQIPQYIPLIGLHPGAKDQFKRWPLEQFAEVGNRLKDHLGCQIVVTGNASEHDLVETLVAKIPGAIGLHGELNLRPLAHLIQLMALMISNDTGPMHVSFAMQTPTLALFCPTDSRLCGPYFAPRVKIIQKQPTCLPCIKKKCREPFCLLQISTSEVYESALSLFYNKASLCTHL